MIEELITHVSGRLKKSSLPVKKTYGTSKANIRESLIISLGPVTKAGECFVT